MIMVGNVAGTSPKKSHSWKRELKAWSIYFTVVLLSIFFHELGHCVPAWLQGYTAIPTAAKNYILGVTPASLDPYISLGGIAATLVFSFVILVFYPVRTWKYGSILLAGAIASPGMYALRFLLKGRGHDGTEFQEAQSAIGFNYEGHALDYLFLSVFMVGIMAWIVKARPHYPIMGRLLIGMASTIIFYVGLQVLNNFIFDPFFK